MDRAGLKGGFQTDGSVVVPALTQFFQQSCLLRRKKLPDLCFRFFFFLGVMVVFLYAQIRMEVHFGGVEEKFFDYGCHRMSLLSNHPVWSSFIITTPNGIVKG